MAGHYVEYVPQSYMTTAELGLSQISKFANFDDARQFDNFKPSEERISQQLEKNKWHQRST